MARAKRPKAQHQVFLARPGAHRLDAQKKSFLFRERSEEARREFLKAVEAIAPHKRVYVDEAGVEDSLIYLYGWSEKGSRYLAERLGHRTERTSVAAAWCQDENGQGKVLSPLIFEGYCNSAVIKAWFEQHLIRELKPAQVVILDNASFHRRARLSEIVAQVGCTLLMLPPYSPDLNKIEPLWHTLKSRIVHNTQPMTFQQKIARAICSL